MIDELRRSADPKPHPSNAATGILARRALDSTSTFGEEALHRPSNTTEPATKAFGGAESRPPDGPTTSEVGVQHLQPLMDAYASTAPHQPARSRLRDQLAAGYLPVARNIARRYAGRGEPLEDLQQVAAIGLLKAIERYNPELGHDFLSYAVPTITGEIRRHFRDQTWGMRVPRGLKDLQGTISTVVSELSARLDRAPRPSEIAAHLQIPTAEVVDAMQAAHAYRPHSLDSPPPGGFGDAPPADTYGRPDPGFELFTAMHSLAPHLAALPEREHSIVIMRFYQDMTQTQIARRIGISQMHVSRILAATLTRLRDAVDTDPGPRQRVGPR